MISIVVPVWNEESRLEKCLKSIRKQGEDYEVIMVNDCSTDRSKDIMLKYTEDKRFKYYENDINKGTGYTLNKGFQLCKGEYVTWFSGDSWMYPGFLTELKRALDQTGKILAYSDWDQVDEVGNLVKTHEVAEYDKKLLQTYSFVGPCAMYRKEVLDKILPICEQICEDYYMWLTLSKHGDFVRVPKVLGCWRNHKNNLTNRINNPSGWYLSSVAKAKARWSVAKYRVAYLCPNLDAANVGWLHYNCFNDLSDKFAVRHILGDRTHLTLGTDTELYNCGISKEAKQILEEADIVHINNDYPDCTPVYDLIKDKPLVVHLHAGPKQWNPAKLRYWQERSKVLSCTPGKAQWMPNFLPVSNLPITYSEYYKPTERNNPKVKLLCHHNYIAGKGILQLKEAFESFNANVLDLREFMEYSIEAQKYPFLQHLLLKKDYDIVIDTLTHGYCGMATWESLAQAAVVICRIDHVTEHVYKEFFGSIPPVINTRLIDDVFENILELLQSNQYKELGLMGNEWIKKYYMAEKILERYEVVYEESLSSSKRL